MSTVVTEYEKVLEPPSRRRPNPEAWKRMMGQKPVAARLEMLPETPLKRGALFTSTTLQLAVVALLVALPMFLPQKIVTPVYEVTPLAEPETAVPLPAKQPQLRPRLPVPVEQPAEPVRVAKLLAPRPLDAPKPKPIQAQTQAAPKLEQPLLEAKFEAPVSAPVRPREPVKTGNLTSGSAAPATVVEPKEKVQTGGFGDPHGLPGPSDANKRANIAHFGSPVLPPGPGYGNGTGGAQGVRGTVASAGFGNGVALTPDKPAQSRGEVQTSGFATAAASQQAPAPQAAQAAPAVQPVEILYKPTPQYSEEARKLGLEGEVLVSVIFPASGPLRVVRVVKGLGHGLDEAAVSAAEQIRFKPALENGKPVDFPATVHIVFQIAF